VLELVPTFWSARQFRVVRDSATVAELRLAWVREGADITIDGVAHQLRREGFGRGAFVLSQVGQPLARAVKPNAFTNRFEVEHAGRAYELRKANWFTRTFEFREGGVPVGSIRPHHPFTGRSSISLPGDLPLPVQVFVTALAVLMWNREQTAAANSATR
jgi:hypothetical protein